ncbi:PREDICTED: ATP-dependent RNA helicase DEAH12, chloroplastic-like [Tarenaya hassleriana]|uniref:ATP-dependent RNA helicase DEAH12, chloroplastic-like n=1 Tax=Tarenaya hassleriana TaxID=28532 RepID=UPI00053C3FC5|nr:PREDICTED: ATP-dependent RNA helicase DEAH12, chloroplastic-like [Tarenaya hassleriana]
MRNSSPPTAGEVPANNLRPPFSSSYDDHHRYRQNHHRSQNLPHRQYPNPSFPPNYRRDQPPRPGKTPPGRNLRSNFVVELLHPTAYCYKERPVPARRQEIGSLLFRCGISAETVLVPQSGSIAGSFTFRQWVDARAAVLSLWDSRLQEKHDFVPRLIRNIVVPSDMDEVNDKLRGLFSAHVVSLLENCEGVKKWNAELDEKSRRIETVSASMKKKGGLGLKDFSDLNDKKKVLKAEEELIAKRLGEFKSAMECILRFLEGKNAIFEGSEEEIGVEVFNLDGGYEWPRIHQLIRRECRRLEDGLPIYAYRRNILRRIHGEQIMVLIGETGSGKSTQLVQFLLDSGVAARESIICTQPRRIAAISLAERVREECGGCYQGNSVCSHPTFSSAQGFNSKVIYMTDHCLLQHCTKDRNLTGVSCIIIDEAHERSLNTDLLLALLKDLLCRRVDLRVVIMSATADACQLSNYFFGCGIYHITGRSFPVEIVYIPSDAEVAPVFGGIPSYVHDVVKMALELHKTEKEGTILAFLTSQAEVEWACQRFEVPSAVALPLHGKLSFEEQLRVFQNHVGKRKVIFSTNIAETSLTIPGVKYVIDSGMVKEGKYEPSTGMSILKVCWVSQSSAKQRAGRAGRTGPGRCYRLYSQYDFELLSPNQVPEIQRVHLGVAVLRIAALGVKSIDNFDFVDAPSPKAIAMAVQNLVQLGAVVEKNGTLELTHEGYCLVNLGLEPRLGKLILGCFKHRMGKEGLVLAAVMANASSIFCRVGNIDDKMKADSLKVQFCNRNGDLFTLLSVYKEWASLPRDGRNRWCWENSINAKSMRRCEDTVRELEMCIEKELTLVCPSFWVWNPNKATEHDKNLKKVILSSLAQNVAMYTGNDQLGYEVALTGQHVQLHPSCSLLAFAQKPSWVVFGELLSVVNQYLVCVTAFDFEALCMLDPPPPFDASELDNRRLRVKKILGCGSILLKRFCGKSNHNLLSLVSRARSLCMDERVCVQVDNDRNEILVYATSSDMEKMSALVNDALEFEKRWLRDECMEKYLYKGRGSVPFALFGSGAQIKHLEVDQRFLTVEVYYFGDKVVDDRGLLMFLEEKLGGSICCVHKLLNRQECDEKEKWGRITFLTPDSAMKATELQNFNFNGSIIKLFPSFASGGGNYKMPSFPSVTVKLRWPRRRSLGKGCLRCESGDIHSIFAGISNLMIGGNFVRVRRDTKSEDSIMISGLDKDLSEAEILDVLECLTMRNDLNFFLFRGDVIENRSPAACEDALYQRIFGCMSAKNPEPNTVRVQVFESKATDYFMKALVTFDWRLHLEAAKALQDLDGKVLPGWLPWQKIKCEQLFQSSLTCSASIYNIIERQLKGLLKRFERQRGAEWRLDPLPSGAYRVKISANATRPVAEMRTSLEELMRGRLVDHPSLSPALLQHLFRREGINLMRTIQEETETYIIFDRYNLAVRICGSGEKIADAEQKLIDSLLTYHEGKQLEIHLRGPDLRPDLMKEVVKRFGPDLQGIKEKVPGVDLGLNIRQHIILVRGSREMKQEVEKIVYELADIENEQSTEPDDLEAACPICLSEIEDGYLLEGCSHLFCKACLLEQFEASMRNSDTFPILCAREGCGAHIVLADLKALLSQEKLDELFRASLSSFVASSSRKFRFCPTPDCPAIYRVAGPCEHGEPFICGACDSETCTKCHQEYHPCLSCERYKQFKEDPDLSLKEWARGKDVKLCPACGHTIEKSEGCNHVECRCGRHICWVCLDIFSSPEPCYDHLRTIHGGIGIAMDVIDLI